MNLLIASTSDRVRQMTRTPQRSVSWFTGSAYLCRFRQAFSAKLTMDFGRLWMMARGASLAPACLMSRSMRSA